MPPTPIAVALVTVMAPEPTAGPGLGIGVFIGATLRPALATLIREPHPRVATARRRARRGVFRQLGRRRVEVGSETRYARELADARAATGVDESVLTGEGRVFGRQVALIASEFDFLAGSIGVAAAERITAAVERATAERLPLLASPSSGGTRMQEGTVAFLQMVKIAAAVEQHKRSHLPYPVYLRHRRRAGCSRRGVRSAM